MMFFARLCGALIAASGLIAAADFALADGLSAAGPRRLLVDDALRSGSSSRLPATPTPLAPGVFVFPFATEEFVGGGFQGFTYFQRVNSAFVRLGEPVYLISGLDDCCASYAENGGAKL